MARGPSTYPRCTRLADGSLLGTHTLFENGENVLAIVRSTDNGASWQAWGNGEAARKPSASHEYETCCSSCCTSSRFSDYPTEDRGNFY